VRGSVDKGIAAMIVQARKQWQELRRFLTDRRVLAELHHLLWRAPFTNGGKRDEGWMCRDHSFFIASLAALLGHQSTIIWGQLALVGATSDGRMGMLRIDTHSWTGVQRIGFFDVSLNPELGKGPGWARWPARCLAGSAFYPHPVVSFQFFTDSERLVWEQNTTKALKTAGFAALYLGERYEDLSAWVVEQAIDIINSPLTDELRSLPGFDSEIYAKAVHHVWEVAHRRKRSLTEVNQTQAWTEIASTALEANRWLVSAAHLPDGNGREDLYDCCMDAPHIT